MGLYVGGFLAEGFIVSIECFLPVRIEDQSETGRYRSYPHHEDIHLSVAIIPPPHSHLTVECVLVSGRVNHVPPRR